MSRRGPRAGARWAVAVVASSVATVSGGNEARANPPAPERFPDPFVVAPKVAERPNVVRKHDGGCFVSYPSGGTAKVDCPKELDGEPIGQEIDRDDATSKCRHVPTTSWSGGSTGETPCPAVLLVVAKPGVIPDPSTLASAAASSNAPPPTGVDPPMGGLQPQSPATIAPKSKDPSKRKDDELPPRATGCANACAIGAR
ncbi:MAG: hypothetical protein ABI175_19665, partial [Polyangiales bacterium]